MSDVATEAVVTDSVVTDGEALPPPELRGRLVIDDSVVETIARRAASTVSQTQHTTGLSRIISADLPRAHVTVRAGCVEAALTVGAKWPTPAAGLARRVREVVTEHIHDYTGLTVTRTDVDVQYIADDDHAIEGRVR